MGVMQDAAFQERILALAIKDRKFLQRVTGVLSRDDFTPKKDDGQDAWARFRAAKVILRYYRLYQQPIGGMLRPEILEYIRLNKTKMGEKARQSLLDLSERLRSPDLVAAPESIETKIIAYKQRQRFAQTIEKLIDFQAKDNLTQQTFAQITREAFRGLNGVDEITDYGATVEQRIKRRSLEVGLKLPYLLIESFDTNVKMCPRGQIAVALAKYGVGKSNFMVHIAKAFALQGLNVLFFTLEDPVTIVENRLDASITNLSLEKLSLLPNKLRKRFEAEWAKYKANIHIVNATGGGWTVERMAEYWEVMRNRGYVADLVIIDYDKKIEPPRRYKESNAHTLQASDTYVELSNWAARDQIFMWVAAQAKRNPNSKEEYKSIVSGDDTADAIDKMREAGLVLGIGYAKQYGENARFLYVAKNRFGRQLIGWPIVGDFERGSFYDMEASREAVSAWTSRS